MEYNDCCKDNLVKWTLGESRPHGIEQYRCGKCMFIYHAARRPEDFEKSIRNGDIVRVHRNKECIDDCIPVDVIWSKHHDGGVCGDGYSEAILECRTCKSKYEGYLSSDRYDPDPFILGMRAVND